MELAVEHVHDYFHQSEVDSHSRLLLDVERGDDSAFLLLLIALLNPLLNPLLKNLRR